LLAAHGFRGVTLIPEGREAERLGDLLVDVLLEVFLLMESSLRAGWRFLIAGHS